MDSRPTLSSGHTFTHLAHLSPTVATNLHPRTLNKKSGRNTKQLWEGQEIVSVEVLEFELKLVHSCMDPKDT